MTKSKITVAELLPTNPEDAIRGKDLCSILKITPRELRRKILHERIKEGSHICANDEGGYYLAVEYAAAEPFIRTMELHAYQQCETVRALKRGW